MAEVRLSLYQAGRPEELPQLCVRCGAPATGTVRRTFVWHPPPGVGPERNRRPDILVFFVSFLTLFATVFFRLLPSMDSMLYAEGRRRMFWWFVGGTVAFFVLIGVFILAEISLLWLFMILFAMAFTAFLTLIYYADQDSPGLRGMQIHATLPTCQQHRDHWERHQMAVLFCVSGLVGMAVAFLIALASHGGQLPGGQWTLLLIIGAGALALLLGLIFTVMRPPVRAVEITEQTVTLAGVAPEFARAMQARVAG
jgi:hypothetical protein